jgi:hypothetical protein
MKAFRLIPFFTPVKSRWTIPLSRGYILAFFCESPSYGGGHLCHGVPGCPSPPGISQFLALHVYQFLLGHSVILKNRISPPFCIFLFLFFVRQCFLSKVKNLLDLPILRRRSSNVFFL